MPAGSCPSMSLRSSRGSRRWRWSSRRQPDLADVDARPAEDVRGVPGGRPRPGRRLRYVRGGSCCVRGTATGPVADRERRKPLPLIRCCDRRRGGGLRRLDPRRERRLPLRRGDASGCARTGRLPCSRQGAVGRGGKAWHPRVDGGGRERCHGQSSNDSGSQTSAGATASSTAARDAGMSPPTRPVVAAARPYPADVSQPCPELP